MNNEQVTKVFKTKPILTSLGIFKVNFKDNDDEKSTKYFFSNNNAQKNRSLRLIKPW